MVIVWTFAIPVLYSSHLFYDQHLATLNGHVKTAGLQEYFATVIQHSIDSLLIQVSKWLRRKLIPA